MPAAVLALGYLLVCGLLCFPLGRILARLPLDGTRVPFAPFSFEQNGAVYQKLHVSQWKKLVPDVSRMAPFLVPKKELSQLPDAESLQIMIRETCVAELVHALLCISGLALLWILPGWSGIVLYLLYVVFGNIPFIIIQRYNRPRLIRLSRRMEKLTLNHAKNTSSQL